METKPTSAAITPPHLISALVTGFNTVTGHIYLILFPIVLDLLLWFGPHLRVKTLVVPILEEFSKTMTSLNAADVKEMVASAQQIWMEAIEHFNLFSSLRSFPVGVPSLFAGQGPLNTPLGPAFMIESPSVSGAVSSWVLISLIGILAGSLYFYLVARLVRKDAAQGSIGRLGWETMQSVLLVLLLIILLLLVMIPVFVFLSVLSLFSITLSQFALLLLSLFIIWLLLPLAFSPFGIFMYGMSALNSALVSYRMIRFYLPGTGLFLLVVILISQGMDILWRVPPDNSWMAVVGILGHAFISTGLIVATFFYYNGGVNWMKDILQRNKVPGIKI